MNHAVFCPRRFARLACQYGREHGRGWAITLLVLGVVLALLAVLVMAVSSGRGATTAAQVTIYYLGLFLSGYLVAHRLHGAWRAREAALVYLMRPASVFEKWLLSALLALVAWPLLYSAVFALVYGVAGHVSYNLAVTAHTVLESVGDRFSSPPDPQDYALYLPLRVLTEISAPSLMAQAMLALTYAALMGYAAATLTWFRRHAGLRALILLIALGMLTLLLLALLGNTNWNGVLFDQWLNRPTRSLPLAARLLPVAFWLGIPALLWLASWRTLLERELT